MSHYFQKQQHNDPLTQQSPITPSQQQHNKSPYSNYTPQQQGQRMDDAMYTYMHAQPARHQQLPARHQYNQSPAAQKQRSRSFSAHQQMYMNQMKGGRQRLMGMNPYQQQMNMNAMQMNQCEQQMRMNEYQQMMMNRNNHQTQSRQYKYAQTQMQNMQNMQMNMIANQRNHTKNNNWNGNKQQNHNSNNNNNEQNNGNKGHTKNAWISPFKNRDQNIDFFMYSYKCQPCPLRKNCQSKTTCSGWHHEGEKRRNPGQDPNFLYSEEACPNVKPQGNNKWQSPSRCPDSDECKYCHTLFEQMYHPNIYKTSICINFTNPEGNKCQYGFYCTHAHGQQDIRNQNKKSNSNSASKTNVENKDNKTSTDSFTKSDAKNNKNSNWNSSNNTSPKMLNLSENKKLDKRVRSQTQPNPPQPQLISHYTTTNTIYSKASNNGNNPMMQQSHGSHSYNLPSNYLPPSNITNMSHHTSYNSYSSPDGIGHNSNSVKSRRVDFSPLQYTEKQYQTTNPYQTAGNHTTNPYQTTNQHTGNHTADVSYATYTFHQRGRSFSADTGLAPYLGTNKPSQPPNLPNIYQQRYPSHDGMYPPDKQPPNIQLMHPTFGDRTRVSQTYNPTVTEKQYKKQIKIQTPDNNPSNNNTPSPPPPTAQQILNDPSMLQSPRTIRSKSHGHLMYPFNSDGNPNDPYLANPNISSQAKMQKLSAPFPNQPTETPLHFGQRKRARSESEPLIPLLPEYNMYSEQSPENLTKHDNNARSHSHDSKSHDPFSGPKRLSSMQDNTTLHGTFNNDSLNGINMQNIGNIDNIAINDILTPQDSLSDIERVPNINDIDQNRAEWDYFGFKPQDIMSPVPHLMNVKDEEIIYQYAKSEAAKKKIKAIKSKPRKEKFSSLNIELKMSEFIKKSAVKNNDDDVNNTDTKDEEQENDDEDGDGSVNSVSLISSEQEWKEWEADEICAWILSLDTKCKKYEKILKKKLNEEEIHGSLLRELNETDLDRFGIKSFQHKKAIMIELKKLTKHKIKKLNANKTSTEKVYDDEKKVINNKTNRDLMQEQLSRYKMFITCPWCNKFDPQTPRNQVLIPCGHLICDKCRQQSQDKDKYKCPICSTVIENNQLLIAEWDYVGCKTQDVMYPVADLINDNSNKNPLNNHDKMNRKKAEYFGPGSVSKQMSDDIDDDEHFNSNSESSMFLMIQKEAKEALNGDAMLMSVQQQNNTNND